MYGDDFEQNIMESATNKHIIAGKTSSVQNPLEKKNKLLEYDALRAEFLFILEKFKRKENIQSWPASLTISTNFKISSLIPAQFMGELLIFLKNQISYQKRRTLRMNNKI